jgi:hypothetical protein
MPPKVKLYPHPDAEGRVGIPVAGEWYSAEDARRLVGQGIATRTAPARPRSKPKAATIAKAPAVPAKEG